MAMIVPTPTVPPRIKPRITKNASHPIRTQRNSIRSSLSERMTATRSFGPVPALLLITMDIPRERYHTAGQYTDDPYGHTGCFIDIGLETPGEKVNDRASAKGTHDGSRLDIAFACNQHENHENAKYDHMNRSYRQSNNPGQSLNKYGESICAKGGKQKQCDAQMCDD